MVVDCQSDLLSSIDSRFVVPLVSRADAPTSAQRLNPIFEIDEKHYVMLTQAASAVRRRDLGDAVASLAERSYEITNAIDVLITGV